MRCSPDDDMHRARRGTSPMALAIPIAAAAWLIHAPGPAYAQVGLLPCPPGGTETELFRNNPDDDSVAHSVPAAIFPDGIPYIDESADELIVNANGNISFQAGNFGFTPEAIPGLSLPTIAPFYADADFRNRPGEANPGTAWVCDDPIGKRILVTWRDVAHFPANDGTASFASSRLNSFQLVLGNPELACDDGVERRGLDVEFRYARLAWHAGTATGSTEYGLCEEPHDPRLCRPAVAGFDAGDNVTFLQVPGSLRIDVHKLLVQTSNVGTPGLWRYRLIDGELPRCGNGVIDACEACDDGNNEAGDGCSEVCVLEFCGDGIAHAALGEECDDGNERGGDGCDGACVFEVCGNGAVQRGEECDDGNDIEGDGCDASCRREDAPPPGDCFSGSPVCDREFVVAPRFGLSGGGCAAASGGPGSALAVLLMMLAGGLSRRRRRRTRPRRPGARLGPAVAAVLMAAPAGARAQTVTQNFPVERFRLASDDGGLLGVEWAAVAGRGSYNLALWLSAADDPLVAFDAARTDRPRWGALVSRRVAGTLVGSLVTRDRLQLGLELPLILSQSSDGIPADVPLMMAPVSAFGLGDVRLVPKLQLVSGRAVDVAAIFGIGLPTSGGDDFRGESAPVLAPELALSASFGPVRMAANLGYRARQRVEVVDLAIDDELFVHAGVGVTVPDPIVGPISSLISHLLSDERTPANEGRARRPARPLELQLAVSGATASRSSRAFNQNHLELLGGATYAVSGPWRAVVAGGAGVREGFGTPDWRLVAAVRYSAARAPLAPEDHDGWQDGDGVPDGDNDGDGIADGDDACPLVAEVENGWRDDDGCPDERPDSDGDGRWDLADACPDRPEDADGWQDDDGCPDADNDGDGVVDTADACTGESGPVENRGCPDTDRDGDAVVDRLDNCPDEPGSVANFGCVRRQLVKLEPTRLAILQRVHFAFNRAEILPASYRLLMNVAEVLRAHPEIGRVRIEGHTDHVGSDAYNLGLSRRRANAVVWFLVKHGRIAADRLVPRGHGESRPIETNATAAGRAANRRVEFNIPVVGDGDDSHDMDGSNRESRAAKISS